MKYVTPIGLIAAVSLLLAATILAHEVTYEGTVAAIKPNPYAASSGIIATLEMTIIDRKRPMVFDITQRTKVVRGSSAVSFTEARIEKDEQVAVTVNHDDPDVGAIEIRLPERK